MRRKRRIEEILADEEECLRRTVRCSLKSLSLPTLKALLRIVRYSEEGKSPMAIAAEDLSVPYKVEIIFRTAHELCQHKARQPMQQEDKEHEG